MKGIELTGHVTFKLCYNQIYQLKLIITSNILSGLSLAFLPMKN